MTETLTREQEDLVNNITITLDMIQQEKQLLGPSAWPMRLKVCEQLHHVKMHLKEADYRRFRKQIMKVMSPEEYKHRLRFMKDFDAEQRAQILNNHANRSHSLRSLLYYFVTEKTNVKSDLAKPIDSINLKDLSTHQRDIHTSQALLKKYVLHEPSKNFINQIFPINVYSPTRISKDQLINRLGARGYLNLSMRKGYFGEPIYKKIFLESDVPMLGHAHPWLPRTSKLFKLELKPKLIAELMPNWFPFLDVYFMNQGPLSQDSSQVDQLYNTYLQEREEKIKLEKKTLVHDQLIAQMKDDERVITMFEEHIFPVYHSRWTYQEAEGAVWLFTQTMSRHIGESHKATRMAMSHFANDLSDCYFDKISGAPQGFILAFRAILFAYSKHPEPSLQQCSYPMKLKLKS